MDRQRTPGFRVHFHPTLSPASQLGGTGILQDLSTFGCRIESPVPMIPDLSVMLRIEVPDWGSPLIIKAARVQWVRGHTFWLGAFQTTERERQRLRQVIMNRIRIHHPAAPGSPSGPRDERNPRNRPGKSRRPRDRQ